MPKIVEDALLIYTDGSLYPKRRKGGYGIVFVHVDLVGEEIVIGEHSPPGISGTTNNRMELQACVDALKMAPDQACFPVVGQIVIRTDSRYVASNYFNALGSWPSNDWKNWKGRPIENADLWKAFKRIHGKIHKPFDIQWVKGHGKGREKDQYNVRADKLAKESAKSPLSRECIPHFCQTQDRSTTYETRERSCVRSSACNLRHRSSVDAGPKNLAVPLSSGVKK